jgi:hypothetical protein
MKFDVIVDVKASRSIRQAQVGASRTTIERTEDRFGLKPEWLVADTAYRATSAVGGDFAQQCAHGTVFRALN